MGIRVLIKGMDKVIEFPTNTKLPDIENSIKVNWNEVESLSGLPMDTASRMERARHLGFDVDKTYYHGSKADIEAFDSSRVRENYPYSIGQHFSDSPNVASGYADDARNAITDFDPKDPFSVPSPEGANVTPVYLKKGNELTMGTMDSPTYAIDTQRGEIASKVMESRREGDPIDSVVMHSPSGSDAVVFDPKNIRSPNAEFNPAKGSSGNLLASVAGATGLVAAGQSNDSEAGVLGAIMKGRHPDIKSFITESPGKATLEKVVVDKVGRGSGKGTEFMKDLVKEADDKGIQLALSPTSDFGGNKNRLKEFYKRFGFVENKGKNKNLEVSESFLREPAKGAVAGGALGLLGLGGLLQPQSAEAKAKANEQPYKEGEPLFTSDQAKGALDILATIGSGLVGQSAGGLAGIATGDPSAIKSVSEGMTRMPSTKEGQEMIKSLMGVLGSADAVNQFLSRVAGDAAWKAGSEVSPEVGAAAGAGAKSLVELFSPI